MTILFIVMTMFFLTRTMVLGHVGEIRLAGASPVCAPHTNRLSEVKQHCFKSLETRCPNAGSLRISLNRRPHGIAKQSASFVVSL